MGGTNVPGATGHDLGLCLYTVTLLLGAASAVSRSTSLLLIPGTSIGGGLLTPLSYHRPSPASIKGHLEVASPPLQNGADPNSCDTEGGDSLWSRLRSRGSSPILGAELDRSVGTQPQIDRL